MLDKFISLMSNETQICSRSDFISYFLLEIVFAMGMTLISIIMSEFSSTLASFIFLLSFILEIIVFAILGTKRLHDLNITGYFIIAIFLFPILVVILFCNSTDYSNTKNKYKENKLKQEDYKLNQLINILETKDNGEKENVNKNIENNETKNNEILTSYKRYYKPKIYITTLNEMKFYNVLLEIAKELDYILFAQVSLYNIISMQDNLDYSTHTRYFNKIASKSIDFVLVDKKCRIKLCIELDDNSHRRKNRIERDNFINALFKDLEIDLLRYPVYDTYYKDTLKRRIQESIKEHYYIK